MSTATVYVIDTSSRRTLVKVTPGKSLREVLEDACRVRKLDPENYTLKSASNKPLDLSQPWRLSGLGAGAKLTLTQASRSPSVVSVALQLPHTDGGGRLQDKFPSTTSLWLLLRKFEDGVAGAAQKLNLTQRGVPSTGSGAGRLMYDQPCLHIMGRNLESFADLQKTLSQLGISNGSVAMRLSFKNSEQPLEEAMQEISQYFADAETQVSDVAEGAHATPNGVMESMPDAGAANAAVPAQADAGPEPNEDFIPANGPIAATTSDDIIASSSTTDPQPSTSESEHPFSKTSPIKVFHPPTSSTPAAALHPDDPSAFEPTLDDARTHQTRLQLASQNQRLLSDAEIAEREAARKAELSTIQRVTVRVRYPNQMMTEVELPASSTAADLYAHVTETLEEHAPADAFELKYTGPLGRLEALPDDSSVRLVRDAGFKGSVLVTMVWRSEASLKLRQGPILKEAYRARARELKVDLANRRAEGEAAHAEAVQRQEEKEREEAKRDSKSKGGGGGDFEAKMRRFLGGGRKK